VHCFCNLVFAKFLFDFLKSLDRASAACHAQPQPYNIEPTTGALNTSAGIIIVQLVEKDTEGPSWINSKSHRIASKASCLAAATKFIIRATQASFAEFIPCCAKILWLHATQRQS